MSHPHPYLPPSRGKEFIWSGYERKSGNDKIEEAPFLRASGGKGLFFAARGTIV
jgi:hypothetical protein